MEWKILNYLMDDILYQIFKIILNIFYKNMRVIHNPSIGIYINEIENRIIFKIKTGYHLELLTSETMKLLDSTKSKITKDENGESVPCLEITEVVLIHYNIVKNDDRQDLKVLHKFVPNKSFSQLLNISPKNLIFLKTLTQSFHILKYGLLTKILNH